jgi:hypothetical protein
MFDYRSLVVDESHRLFPFFVRQADCAERVSPQKQQQKMDIEHAKIPYGRRYGCVSFLCVEQQSRLGPGVAGLECSA